MNKQRTPLTLLLTALALIFAGKPGWAEGSRDLYPSSYPAGGSRATAFYSTDLYGNLLKSHTIFYVYAKQNEYILLGSSAIGVGSGDALIYAPGAVTGPVGGETFGAAAFRATTAQPGRGVINSRALELAGPQAISGGGNSGGYVPCYYQVPSTGIYGVVFYGPDGPSVARNGSPDGTVNFSSSNSAEAGTGQHTNVTAWDVTVRSSDPASTTDEKGRVFANYLTLFTGGNARPLYSSLYAATLDGYQYQISLLGMDPNAFAIYGNQVGFFDSDGTTPLYHDILGHDANVSSPEGNVKLAVPTFPLFFNTPDSEALTEDNIPLSPITPVMTGLTFHGTLNGNTSTPGAGGTFTFSSNVSAIYDLVISRDSVDFDPTNPNNRRLRGLKPSGGNTVSWDGKDNSGVAFPVGTNYAVHGEVHGGEYHFPMLDVENNLAGGPSFTLLNATNPHGNSTGYYDDRGYRTAGGFYVTYSASNSPASSNNASLVNHVLGGLSPPSTTYSNPISGFNTVTSSQRAFGNYSNPGGGNQNVPNTGSFGDTKGLDIWTYTASADDNATLNILTSLPPTVLLVKRITAINGADVTGFADDPGTTDDNNPNWPSPAGTYLRGGLSAATVRPGDVVDFTVYYLVTDGAVGTFTLCDPLPANMTFLPDAYDGLSPTDGGLAGTDDGIALASSGTVLPTAPSVYLSNVADSDRGRFYAPGTAGPAAANRNGYFASPLPAAQNTGGVVAVTVVSGASTLPAATAPGSPANSYGFVRFRAKVN